MPLGRYFAFAGSLLLALLFLADWYMPGLGVEPARAGVDRSVIRIHTAHKWPNAIVFDTSLPTIVPPPSVMADAPVPRSPRQAFAMAPRKTEPPAEAAMVTAPPRHVVRRTRTARAPAARIASFETIGYRSAPPAGW